MQTGKASLPLLLVSAGHLPFHRPVHWFVALLKARQDSASEVSSICKQVQRVPTTSLSCLPNYSSDWCCSEAKLDCFAALREKQTKNVLHPSKKFRFLLKLNCAPPPKIFHSPNPKYL